MNIAVTGGYGTGKSSVTAILTSLLDAKCFSADRCCREQLQSGAEGWRKLKDSWGDDFFNDRGEIDRLRVKKKIFSDNNAKKELEEILHPLVRKANRQLASQCELNNTNLISEIPLLYEKGLESEFDLSVVVYVSERIALQRGCKRDKLDRSTALQIIKSQLSISDKVKKADYVVNNSGMQTATFSQVLNLSSVLKN